MGAWHHHSEGFYEVVPCKFCGDDTRRVVCSEQSCDHVFCVKERGVCFECASEKLGAVVTSPPVMTLHEYERDPDFGSHGFDNAIRLLEDMG